jgi:hypothetical protein
MDCPAAYIHACWRLNPRRLRACKSGDKLAHNFWNIRPTNRQGKNAWEFVFLFIPEPFKLAHMHSQPQKKEANITIRRQRHPNRRWGWVGLVALSKLRR